MENEIIDLEKEALDHWSKGDIQGYFKHASDDITYMDDIGASKLLEGRDKVLEYASNLEGQIPEHRYEMINANTQLLGSTAVLTFQYHPSTLTGDRQTPWKATTVYSRTKGDWHMVHAHWSMIKTTG
jgi:hypothetical protein